jgi:hypothetical protein
MQNFYNFKEINIGDLLIQKIINPVKQDEYLQRRGIIIEVKNNISTVQWINSEQINTDLKTTTILNTSLRKMIMNGMLQHYPVKTSDI